MIVEIRKSFERDAMKLPTSKKKELAEIIAKMKVAKKLSELSSCKNLLVLKIRIE